MTLQTGKATAVGFIVPKLTTSFILLLHQSEVSSINVTFELLPIICPHIKAIKTIFSVIYCHLDNGVIRVRVLKKQDSAPIT